MGKNMWQVNFSVSLFPHGQSPGEMQNSEEFGIMRGRYRS